MDNKNEAVRNSGKSTLKRVFLRGCALFFVIICMLFSVAGKAAEDKSPRQEETDAVSVSVSLRGVDAELSNEVARLRREVGVLEERQQELERENRALREERELLGRELIESIKQIEGQDERLLRWQLGVAELYAKDAADGESDREARLLNTLHEVSSSGRTLAVQVAEFCREVDSLMAGWALTQVQRAQLKLLLGPLETKSRQFSALVDWGETPGMLEKCRILAVHRDLRVVVLPVGTACGAFNGLVYHVTGKEDVRLTLVSVRAFVAVAIVSAGSIETLSPGMEAVTEPKKNTEE